MNKLCISHYLQILRRKLNMISVLWAIVFAILIIPNTALALTFEFTFGDGFSQEEIDEINDTHPIAQGPVLYDVYQKSLCK